MRRSVACMLVIGCLAMSAGCDRGKGPGNAVATTAPATAPVPVGPAQLTVLTTALSFPPAHARLARKAGGFYVQVFSQDPPPGQERANMFYFDMNMDLDDEDAGGAGAAHWVFATASRERSELPVGINVGGGQQVLQPRDVEADLKIEGNRLTVKLSGQFALFAGDAATALRDVPVHGEFVAQIDSATGPVGRP